MSPRFGREPSTLHQSKINITFNVDLPELPDLNSRHGDGAKAVLTISESNTEH